MSRAWVLGDLSRVFTDGQQWERAERVIGAIEDSEVRAEMLLELARIVEGVGKHEQLVAIVRRSWQQADTRGSAIKLLPLAAGLILLKPEVSSAFCEAFSWVDSFLKGKEMYLNKTTIYTEGDQFMDETVANMS